MSREPLLFPAVALACGIVLAHFYYFQFPDLLVPAGLALFVLLASWFAKPAVWYRRTATWVCMALLGMATQVHHRNTWTPKLDIADGETALLSGCVVDPPVYGEGRALFLLELAKGARARISVSLPDDATLPMGYGQRVELAGSVRTPRNFGNPGAFDYSGYLAQRQTFWTVSVRAPGDVHKISGACPSSVARFGYTLRTVALARLQSLWPEDAHTAGLFAATLLGQTAGLERRWTAEFRATGTYHAIVISGLHVFIVTGTLLFLLRCLRVPQLPALSVATCVAWLYAFVAGFNAPVVRSAAGFSLFLLASVFFRRTRLLNVLGLVAIVYLLFDPDQLFDPSFLLSFLSAAAIAVYAVPMMERYLEPWRQAVQQFGEIRFDPSVPEPAAVKRVELRLLAQTMHVWTKLSVQSAQTVVEWSVRTFVFLAEAIVLTSCVQFALALPMITFFHRLSFTGLSTNILVVPLISLMIPAGFAALLTCLHPCAVVARWLLLAAETVTSWHMHFEPSWRIAAIPITVGLLFCCLLVLLGFAVRHKRCLVLPVLAAALLVFCLLIAQPWRPDVQAGKLEVTNIDVGQGDSELVVFPNGETMLVDAGGFPGAERMKHKPQMDIGEDVVSPYLWFRHIHRLDYAVLTHGHSDHMGGLPAILDNFHPRILWTGAEPDSPEWRNVCAHAQADGTSLEKLNRSFRVRSIGGVKVQVLAPAPEYVVGTKAENNDSLVLQLSIGKQSVVLTGDAERPVEDDLLQAGLLTPVTLLKVGHHGSRTSSSIPFLNGLTPRFGFISDGYLNQFHHPHPEVLRNLQGAHTAVFRTDRDGALTFLTDGKSVDVRTFH